METNRIKLIVAGLLLGRAAQACGPWYEEAPPLLPYYLDRLPAKSFGTIYLETKPDRPEVTKVAAPSQDDLLALAFQLPTTSRADLIKQADRFLAAARENYTNGDTCNLLHDLRDALACQAPNADVGEYIKWRVEHRDWFNVANTSPMPDQIASSKSAAELEKRFADAPEALKPQWLYLRGAFGFCQGDRMDCQPWFERVWKEYPGHPRAEAALFLSARCALSLSRAGVYSQEPPEMQKKEYEQAPLLFQQYVEKYPKGRFLTDAYGWMGAIAWEKGDNAEALRDYARQVEAVDHPEVAKSALLMCERVLRTAKAGDDALFEIVAQHPVVAMGATYFALNSAQDPGDNPDPMPDFPTVDAMREFESTQARKWRQTVLPRLAAAIAAHKAKFQPDGWPAKYLAILAHAASEAGQQDQALALTAVPQLGKSDDLLLARGIAFQRAGRAKEAIATYRTLLEKFPKSQLARGTRLKLALMLVDDHQAGQALLELKKIAVDEESDEVENRDSIYPPADSDLDFTASGVHRNISGAESHQIDQITDVIYGFAPLSELTPLAKDPALGKQVSAVLAERYLAREDFSEAKKYMAKGDAQIIASQAPFETGNAWADARFKLLKMPLDSSETEGNLFASNDNQAAQRRRENARALGFKNIDTELEERDELRHASRWWMRAARAQPGTPLAAAARLKALEAMPRIAAATDYAFERAVETKAAATSRELYDRLRTECPDSIEAKQAAYWSFPERGRKPSDGRFLDYSEHTERERDAIGAMGYTVFDDGAFKVTNDFVEVENDEAEQKMSDKRKEIEDRILALGNNAASWDTARLAAEVEAIRNEVRPVYRALEEAAYLNFLDDLALFLQEPNLTPETRRAYFALRLEFNRFTKEEPAENTGDYEKAEKEAALKRTQKIEQLMADPALKPVQDYIDFIAAARVSGYPAMEQEMREFLAAYPKSRKREAARLLLARTVHWLMTPMIATYNAKDGQDLDPEKAAEMQTPTILKTEWRERFDAARAMEALDAYDQEFPHGRYAADIRDYRGAAALHARLWGPALDATLANLDDESHPDLQPEAALRLANIFAGLADAKTRGDVMEAIRQRPKAVERLQEYLTQTWAYKDHPLRYLGGYLADQLGFHIEEPPEPKKQDTAAR